MGTVALIPAAGKPVTAGHWGLIELAASECDEVHLFVSTADRVRKGEMPIYGRDMMRIWDDYLEPSLPDNVSVEYVPVPVQSVYAELEGAEASNDASTKFVIYSDSEDIFKYSDTSLSKAAPKLFKRGNVHRRGVSRGETVDISGTKMRAFLASGDRKNFKKFLPPPVRQYTDEIMAILMKGKIG